MQKFVGTHFVVARVSVAIVLMLSACGPSAPRFTQGSAPPRTQSAGGASGAGNAGQNAGQNLGQNEKSSDAPDPAVAADNPTESACAVLDQIPRADPAAQDSSWNDDAFTVLARLDDAPSARASEKSGRWRGALNLRLTPQLAYALSGEAATEIATQESGKGPARKKIDPPTREEFLELARAQNKAGKLSDFRYWMLKHKSARDQLKIRNQKVREQIEVKIPGAFDDEGGDLAAAELLLPLYRAWGDDWESRARRAEVGAALERLTVRTRLFGVRNWESRRRENERVMRALARGAQETAPASTEESACRFYLGQRWVAQMLTLKGIARAPSWEERGHLFPYPVQDEVRYPEQMLNSAIYADRIVTPELMRAQVADDKTGASAQNFRPDAGATGAAGGTEFISYFRYLVAGARHRDARLWSTSNLESAYALALPASLLRLNLGLVAVSASTLRNFELRVGPEGHLSLREDGTEAFVTLGRAVLEGTDALATLRGSGEAQVLSAGERAEFLAPYPRGLVEGFETLLGGVAYEGLQRIRAGDPSPALRALVSEIGERFDNDILRAAQERMRLLPITPPHSDGSTTAPTTDP